MNKAQKKIAIFVEGQTEQIFLYRLLNEIAGKNKISFTCERMHGGSPGPTLWLTQNNSAPDSVEYKVLLVDCMGDETVKSVMLDRKESLKKAGYSLVLGLRDIYPKPVAELAKMRQRLAYGLPTVGLPMRIIVAVAEVEAWFLQEHNHFAKIDPRLDPNQFGALFGFDPLTQSAEGVEHPAELLNKIYSTVGLQYKKKKDQAERTVEALDYENIYMECAAMLPQLDELIKCIDEFLQ